MDGLVFPPHTRDVECFYINEVEELSAPTLAVGILTGWSDAAPLPVKNPGYVGLRIHGCGNEEEHHCSSWVMVDSMDDGSPRLAFRVGRRLADGESAVDSLGQAHDELIGLFRLHTPDWLRAKWGES